MGVPHPLIQHLSGGEQNVRTDRFKPLAGQDDFIAADVVVADVATQAFDVFFAVLVKPDEIAAAALYLAADESSMVTGTNLIIDGGWSAGK